MFIENKEDKVFIPQTKNTITANDYNQIKNEIQNAIELAGLTPEKDIIQLPSALRKLTEQSGAEEVVKIEAEGAEQTALVAQEGSRQVQRVQNAAVEEIELAKAWANKTDGPVADGEYSAKKYAQDAASNAALAGDKAQKDLSNVAVKSGEETFVIRPDGTGYLDILNNRTTAGLGVGPDGTPNVRILDERHKLLSAKDVTDYIVETGASADQWYRKYKSGWVEQGGYWTPGGYGGNVTYPVPFANTNYCLLRTNNSENAGGPQIRILCVMNVTATGVYVNNAQLAIDGAYWYACGQGA